MVIGAMTVGMLIGMSVGFHLESDQPLGFGPFTILLSIAGALLPLIALAVIGVIPW